jgi:hypothetical protein
MVETDEVKDRDDSAEEESGAGTCVSWEPAILRLSTTVATAPLHARMARRQRRRANDAAATALC